MKSVICTLFEGHYHYGVAVLVNSLYKVGFRGDFYVGYKGELPDWSKSRILNPELGWNGAETMTADGIELHFMPLKTDCHLTNYKPNFMLELLKGSAKDADSIFYFDPDIVLKANWTFFEKWVLQGVALVHEITGNDMPTNHPVRKIWRDVLNEINLSVKNDLYSYINAGFLGLKRSDIIFLEHWESIMEHGFKNYGISPYQLMDSRFRRDHPFFCQDQDGMNMAAMSAPVKLSEAGPEYMDLIYGGDCMSHAIGSPKPWKKLYLKDLVLFGKKPTLADKNFWIVPSYPIKVYKRYKVKIMKIEMKTASFISRFYRRN